jgi:hypothetical protein
MARGEGEDLTVPEEFFEDDFKEFFLLKCVLVTMGPRQI